MSSAASNEPRADAEIRSARESDIPALLDLINRFAEQNLMLPRTREQIQRSLQTWLVAEGTDADDPALVGCGAVIALTDTLAEVRSLAVDESQHGRGLGSRLVVELETLARRLGFRKLCALTLREGFFQRLGFQVVDRWSISPKLWQECIYCPKFHRCDEVAVLKSLTNDPLDEAEADTTQPAAWNPLLKYSAWQPLRLAYNKKPIALEEQDPKRS